MGGFLLFVIIIIIIVAAISKSQENINSNNTLVINDPNADPSFMKKWIEWNDGEITAYTKYIKSNETKSYKLGGTYKAEGDKLMVYAKSNYLGSQGVNVKIGWVDSECKMYFSNKWIAPYHNDYVKKFYNDNRDKWGDSFCDKQIKEKQTEISEGLVAFVDGSKNIKTANGTLIAKVKGNSQEAAAVMIFLFFEGWPPLDDRFKSLCNFWNSKMSG